MPKVVALALVTALACVACSRKDLPRFAPSCSSAPRVESLILVTLRNDGTRIDPFGAYDDEIEEASERASIFDVDRDGGFTRTTDGVRVSQVPPHDDDDAPIHVALWANTDAKLQYARLQNRNGTEASDTEAPETSEPFPEGTVLVREVRTEDDEPVPDEPAKVMAKLSRGYAPAMNDWWFGERDPVTRAVRAAATPCTCMGCHGMHALSDLVVGPPAPNAQPPAPGSAYGG